MVAARLDGLHVAVTRDVASSEEFAARLRALGAAPVVCPCIEIVHRAPAGLDEALAAIDRFDWLVFTSANAVASVIERLRHLGYQPADHLSRIRVAAVGRRTSGALAALGVEVDLLPKVASAAGLAEDMIASGLEGRLVLFPASRIAGPDLPEALRRAGAGVVQLAVYDTACPGEIPPAARVALNRGEVDVLTFASPSAVRNFVDLVGAELLSSVPVVCIGETTGDAARDAGVAHPIIAPEPSTCGLIDALLQFKAQTRREASTHD